MPTAETTLLPAYGATSKTSLTSSARLDTEPNPLDERHGKGLILSITIR